MNCFSPSTIKAAYATKKLQGTVTHEEESIFQQFLRSLRIDEELEKENEILTQERKVLVLGAADSGKSTFVKQMRLQFGDEFEEYELSDIRNALHRNIVSAARSVIKVMKQTEKQCTSELGMEACAFLSSEKCDFVETRGYIGDKFPPCISHLQAFWTEEVVKEVVYSTNKSLTDNTQYLFENLDRISKEDFIADANDILSARILTSGVWETALNYKSKHYRFIDVGGQRSERRKWFHFFDDVTAVIFCISLNSYDRTLEESPLENQMEDSLKLFKQMVNHSAFSDIPFIVFFNKKDLLESIVEHADSGEMQKEFPDATDSTYENIRESIKQRFLDVSPRTSQLQCHYTCALEKESMEKTFRSIDEILDTVCDK